MVHCIVRIISSESILPFDIFLSGIMYILPLCTITIVPGRSGVAPRIIVSIMALSVTLFWTTEPSTEAAGNCTILALPHFACCEGWQKSGKSLGPLRILEIWRRGSESATSR